MIDNKKHKLKKYDDFLKKKVFLGGTCNESTWRNKLIKKLKIEYFNPVVKDWNDEAYKEELKQREECDYCLYVITPLMTGVYSIAEVVDDSNKRPEKTIFCFISDEKDDEKIEFTEAQNKSLKAVGKMVEKNGAVFLSTLNDVADFLNFEKYYKNINPKNEKNKKNYGKK